MTDAIDSERRVTKSSCIHMVSGIIRPASPTPSTGTSITSVSQAYEPRSRVLSGRVHPYYLAPSEPIISPAIINTVSKDFATSASRDSTTSKDQALETPSCVLSGHIHPLSLTPSEPLNSSAITSSATGDSTPSNDQAHRFSKRMLSGRIASTTSEPPTSPVISDPATGDSTISDRQAKASSSVLSGLRIRSPGFPSSSTSSVPTVWVDPSPTDSTGRVMRGRTEVSNGRVHSSPLRPSAPVPTRSTTTSSTGAVEETKTASAFQGSPANAAQPIKKAIAVSDLPVTTVTPPVSSVHREKATGKYFRTSNGVVEDFEFVSEAELDDDDFDFLDNEGPSAANGKMK